MLEVRSFQDLLETLGKLAPWLEDAGQVMGPSAAPPDDLVRKFADALNIPSNNPEGLVTSEVSAEITSKIQPSEIIAESDLFHQPSPVENVNPTQEKISTSLGAEGIDNVNVGQQVNNDIRFNAVDHVHEEEILGNVGSTSEKGTKTFRVGDADQFNDAQKINLNRGMEAIDSARAEQTDLRKVAQELIDFFRKDASQLSPSDLLRAQQIVGMLKYGAESGIKVSEGISETFEQLLEQQG